MRDPTVLKRRRPLSLPYEDQMPLLVALLEPVPSAEAIEPVGPERATNAILHHNLAGYAAAAIASGRLRLPADAGRRIAQRGAVRVIHARRLRQELPEIEPVIAEACGTRPVLLKGPSVADRFYPDARLRPFADLDLLVPRARLRATVDAAASLGYEPLEEFAPGFAEAHGHDVHVRRRRGSQVTDLELHWRIGDDPATSVLDHDRLSSSAVSLEVAGAGVLAPSIPDQLLCLAVHLLSDRAKRLVWVNDLALTADAASEPDWQRAFESADEAGLGWVMHRALDYAARHLRHDRPRPLPPGAPPPWGPLRAVEDLDARASTHVGRLAALGWRDRARYLRTVLVPTRAGLRGTVGSDGAPTWRLVARHVRTATGGLRPPRRN
jgi:hypothetical protein